MGLGTYPMGIAPLGVTPPYKAAPRPAVLTPRAVKYDPRLRQYVLWDPATGAAIDVHPIDQIVATRLTVEQGQSASNPALGQRIRARLRAASPAQHPAIAKSEVLATLKDLIDAGDVLLVGVTMIVNPVNGAKEVQVSYVNLRADDVDPLNPQAAAVNAPPVVLGR